MISTILIADDDPVQRRLLEAMVRRFGYEAETVESGDQALARLERTEGPAIDLLILDLVMPDLDGMGVLAKMRERKIGAPVVVQTAHG
ncbi:MAG: response regulator, partial [Hyphomicrobiales bacterium]|nr:response regulator [Hyphomicrobiales bacterium]